MKKGEQDKGTVYEIFIIICNRRILDRIEAVPEAVVKRSTVRTHLDHFIAQVQVYWNIYNVVPLHESV
jgi:hypothetical protein